MSSIEIELLDDKSLRGVASLRDLEGWNQTDSDLRRLRALSPTGCFVARCGSQIAGSVTTTAYGKDLAWIGMMLVHPEFRRKGIGTRLMERALSHLENEGVVTIKLDATPAGQPVYEKLGFLSESTLTRYGVTLESNRQSNQPTDATRDLIESDWPTVLAMDWPAFGADRSCLLDRLRQDSSAAKVWPTDGPMKGWGMVRAGLHSAYLGPMVCAEPEALRPLVRGLIAVAPSKSITWDFFDSKADARRLGEEYGFVSVRPLTRMRRGPGIAPGRGEQLIGAIADPSVG